jgi:hypothetical protein
MESANSAAQSEIGSGSPAWIPPFDECGVGVLSSKHTCGYDLGQLWNTQAEPMSS